MDSGKARANERVELRTYLRPPKELFAFGRLWEFQRSRKDINADLMLYQNVATYRPSRDQHREMDVMAWVLALSDLDGPFIWVTYELLVFIEVPPVLDAPPILKKITPHTKPKKQSKKP